MNYQTIKSADDQTGTFTGLASVFDTVDYDGDIVRRGAFSKSLGSGTPIPLRWMHKADDPRNYVGDVVEARRRIRNGGRPRSRKPTLFAPG